MFKINSLKMYINTILIFNVSIIFIQTLLVHLPSNQTETIRVKFGHSYLLLPTPLRNRNDITVHIFLHIF